MSELTDTHPHYLCVYGTLKPGHGNNPLIVKHGGKDIGPCRTVGQFLLNDGFPYVWHVVGKRSLGYADYYGKVVGHLYKVSHEGLEACDWLEGHPRHYVRTNIPVAFGPGAKPMFVTAGIYLAPGAPVERNVLQRPRNGLLEWGREEPTVAKNFQRQGKR